MTRIPVLQPFGRQDAVIPHVYRPRMAAAMEQLSAAVYQETTLTYREAEGVSPEPVPLPYDDDFWERLHANFDEGEIADLTYSITTWIATGRVVHALGLDGACGIPNNRA